MVGAVTTAACGQARIIIGCAVGRERTKAEEENKEDGEEAPHLETMLHEGVSMRNGNDKGVRVVGYHRCIAHH